MKIRLGYVAISNALGKKVTSSSNVTYKTYSKITSEEKKIEKLKSITHSNFEGLEKILRYNIENDIHFYRLTSALIPLTTHPDVPNWGYRKLFKKDFEYIGKLIKKNNMRVDTHPDQFNVINSANDEVVKNTIKNLSRQVEWFEDMDYPIGISNCLHKVSVSCAVYILSSFSIISLVCISCGNVLKLSTKRLSADSFPPVAPPI